MPAVLGSYPPLDVPGDDVPAPDPVPVDVLVPVPVDGLLPVPIKELPPPIIAFGSNMFIPVN